MNQMKYRLNVNTKSQLAQLKQQLAQESRDKPVYASAPKTWEAFKAQCKPLEFVRK